MVKNTVASGNYARTKLLDRANCPRTGEFRPVDIYTA